METEIIIRAFRATDDKETCIKFIDGHRKVLENHGINKVTSSNDDWMYSKSVFVIVVETMDREKLYGGARIHAVDGIHPLPIEDATIGMDPKIYNVVRNFAVNGTGELCGLWNSMEVAGYGIGSLFPIRAALVILEQIGLQSVFFLCSPLTVRFNKWVGSRILTELGNNGTFYYPKLDLLATAVILENAIELNTAHPREQERIHIMRKDLNMSNIEKSPFKNISIKVHYQLQIPGSNPAEFKINY